MYSHATRLRFSHVLISCQPMPLIPVHFIIIKYVAWWKEKIVPVTIITPPESCENRMKLSAVSDDDDDDDVPLKQPFWRTRRGGSDA